MENIKTELTVVDAIKDRDYEAAVDILDREANCFGFFRKAATMVDELAADTEAIVKGLVFAEAWVDVLASLTASKDGRDERCVETAVELQKVGYTCVNPEVLDAVRTRMLKMHPTVLQQASVFVFRMIDVVGGKPPFAEFDDWYKMPLI